MGKFVLVWSSSIMIKNHFGVGDLYLEVLATFSFCYDFIVFYFINNSRVFIFL